MSNPQKRLPVNEENKITKFFKNLVKKAKRTDKKFVKGQFYTYEYSSKLYEEEKLDFYDKQPYILMLEQNDKYMWGLNFHYLNYATRIKVIKRLKKRYKKRWDEDKYLPSLSWKVIEKEVKYGHLMLKLYIKNRITRPVRIPLPDVEKTVKMPSEKFIGIDSNDLWRSLGLK